MIVYCSALTVASVFFFFTGGVDKTNSKRALESAGFTEIEFTGYKFLSCGEDIFRTGFKAKNVRSQQVNGVVCCGLFKNCTIRY